MKKKDSTTLYLHQGAIFVTKLCLLGPSGSIYSLFKTPLHLEVEKQTSTWGVYIVYMYFMCEKIMATTQKIRNCYSGRRSFFKAIWL